MKELEMYLDEFYFWADQYDYETAFILTFEFDTTKEEL